MNPKDRFDVINGIIANLLATIAITIAIRRRPKHKKQNRFRLTLPAGTSPPILSHRKHIMRTSLIFGIVALTFGAMALGGALSDSPTVSGGFGLAAGIMGLAAGIINGKEGNNDD